VSRRRLCSAARSDLVIHTSAWKAHGKAGRLEWGQLVYRTDRPLVSDDRGGEWSMRRWKDWRGRLEWVRLVYHTDRPLVSDDRGGEWSMMRWKDWRGRLEWALSAN